MGVIQKGRGGGGAEVFTSDFVVNLTPPKTLGKYGNGETVPANGKTAKQVLLDIAQEYITPVFYNIIKNPTIVEVNNYPYNLRVDFNLSYAFNSLQVQLINVTDNNNVIVIDSVNTVINGNYNNFISFIVYQNANPLHLFKLRSINSNGSFTDSYAFNPFINTSTFWGLSDTLPLIADAQSLINTAKNENKSVPYYSYLDIEINFNSSTEKYFWWADPITNNERKFWFLGVNNRGEIGSTSSIISAPQNDFVTYPTFFPLEPVLWTNKEYRFYFSKEKTIITTPMYLSYTPKP